MNAILNRLEVLAEMLILKSNYATKTDLKNVTHTDTSNFALKTNLANLKT